MPSRYGQSQTALRQSSDKGGPLFRLPSLDRLSVKFIRFLTSAALFMAGGLLAVYGLFALTFNERGGSTYVMLVGHRLDAHLVGAVSLVVGLAIIAAGFAHVLRGRLHH